MVAEGLGRGPAPKARAEGALENFGLFRPGFHEKAQFLDPDFTRRPSKRPNIFRRYAPEPLAQRESIANGY